MSNNMMDIYMSPPLPLQTRRLASNANNNNTTTTTHTGRPYVRHLPPKHVDLPLRPNAWAGDDEDDFPTPRASQQHVVYNPTASPGPGSSIYSALRSPALKSPLKSPLRESTSSQHTAFEEDIECSSGDDSEIVPFQVSDSIKKKMIAKTNRVRSTRVPSLVIPSPHLWPNVNRGVQQRQQQQQPTVRAVNTSLLSADNVPRTPLSPDALAKLDSSYFRKAAASTATPSLNESLTTDEHANSFSCPSTPDLQSAVPDDDDEAGASKWDLPMQIHPDALEMLSELSLSMEREKMLDIEEQVDEGEDDVTPPAVQEPRMEMLDRGVSLDEYLATAKTVTRSDGDDAAMMDGELSPISVPSPRGLFSAGERVAPLYSHEDGQQTPNTGTAETFYGVPWRLPTPARAALPQIVEVEERGTDGPPTARRLTHELGHEVASLTMVNEDEDEYEVVAAGGEFDENYAKKLSVSALDHKSRTDWWIEMQERYLAKNKDLPPIEPGASAASTPDMSASGSAGPSTASASTTTTTTPATESAASFAASPPKKTVRFADHVEAEERSRDSILYHAFQHLRAQERPRDAFIHRHTRINALRMQRAYMKEQHRCRLRGSFDLSAAPQLRKQDWLHARTPAEPEEVAARESMASTAKEQRALQQLSHTSWYLQAASFLDGGSLLPQASLDVLAAEQSRGGQARVLDFGGQPTAGWGWAVATGQRDVKVYTVVPTRAGIRPDWLAHRGPSNHRIASVPNAWTLPFPSGFFHVISARTLHLLLRTNAFPAPAEEGRAAEDEYDATLRELHRVLAPGGTLNFSLMDAEVSAPANSALAARSVEFAVALRTRGYDACAGRRVVGRLEKVGFAEVKRSWVSLPWVSKSVEAAEADAQQQQQPPSASQSMDAITGLVGSMAWEQWMLKFQSDVGKTGDALLAGVAEALDAARTAGGAGGGVAWSMLVGCARKE